MVEGIVVNRDFKNESLFKKADNPITRRLVAEIVYKNTLGNHNLVDNFVHHETRYNLNQFKLLDSENHG